MSEHIPLRGAYALRCVKIRCRHQGDHVNEWRDEVVPCPNAETARTVVANWNRTPVGGQVYAFAGVNHKTL